MGKYGVGETAFRAGKEAHRTARPLLGIILSWNRQFIAPTFD